MAFESPPSLQAGKGNRNRSVSLSTPVNNHLIIAMHINPTGVNRQQMRGNSVLGKTVILGWEFETIEAALIGHLGGDLDPWGFPFVMIQIFREHWTLSLR